MKKLETTRIQNGRVAFALHRQKAGEGTPLLLLHELYASSAKWNADFSAWPGPIFALDFSGHGESDWLRGGSYAFDRYLSDADLALREIGGRAAIAGAGMGAWYGLIVAGSRPERVPGCLLLPGAGLVAAGSTFDPRDVRPRFPTPDEIEGFDGDADPFTLGSDREPRPVWFATPFAQAAHRIVLVEEGGERPEWWRAVTETPAASSAKDLPRGLAELAAASAA